MEILNKLIDVIPCGTIVWKTAPGGNPSQMELIFANATASEFEKRDLSTEIGKQFSEVFPEADITFVQKIHECATQQSPFEWGEISRKGFIFHTSILPVGNNSVSVTFLDWTELMQSNRELEQFAYVASHDLQEPLRMIASYTQLLTEEYGNLLDDEGLEYARYVVNGANRMKRLIDDLLRLSRVNRHSGPPVRTSMNKALEDVVLLLNGHVEQNVNEFRIENLPDVCADPGQIRQVWQNLVSNAVKYRSTRPLQIHVGVKTVKGVATFFIKDNGIGMESEYLERIFWVFHRLHSVTDYPGTGIGLAVVEKIIKRHNGTVWAESELGKGTTIYFTLPLAEMDT